MPGRPLPAARGGSARGGASETLSKLGASQSSPPLAAAAGVRREAGLMGSAEAAVTCGKNPS